MQVTVVGTGRVGLVTATGLAQMGHDVLGVDANAYIESNLSKGKTSFYEPGLDAQLNHCLSKGTIKFSQPHRIAGPLEGVVIVTVDTPVTSAGMLAMSNVDVAIKWIAEKASPDTVVAMKSSVLPGTGEMLREHLLPHGIEYVSNPEFLREGQALTDWKYPSRTLIGSDSETATATIKKLYSKVSGPLVVTDITTSEMVKYASNALLATRISFMNEMAEMCDVAGANVDMLADVLAMDSRLGQRINPGVGYGGPCFDACVTALQEYARRKGFHAGILEATTERNEAQWRLLLHLLQKELGYIHDKKIAMLGLSYKPDTDDVRDSTSIKVLQALSEEGANINYYDPHVSFRSQEQIRVRNSRICNSPEMAIQDAHAVLLMTPWPELVDMDWTTMHGIMQWPNVLIDARNALDATFMEDIGYQYWGFGRNFINLQPF